MAALYALFAIVVVALGVVAASTLVWMLYAWRTPDRLARTTFPAPSEPRLSFSLIVPARHEERVLGHTLDTLAGLDYPVFEVVVVVGNDDHHTAAAARAAARRHPDVVRIVVDSAEPKSKPRALNAALPSCRLDVVGVFDAEDDVHPDLLRRVDSLFASSGAEIVQAGVQLVNWWSSWFAVRNCLEYYFWFRSRLHFHADARFIPLGGNTVFVRRATLEAAGGWDPDCLAEDCELGVRLSVAGARVAVAYEPELVTREETPSSLGALFRQRTRWNQGFLQVLRKGVWRQLPSPGQRALARYTLAMPFLQALTAPLIPASIVAIALLDVPVVLAMFSFVPLFLTLTTLVVELVGLRDLRELYPGPRRRRDYVRLIAGLPAYQSLLAAAAVRAAWRERRGRRDWEKTTHSGLHLALDGDPAS